MFVIVRRKTKDKTHSPFDSVAFNQPVSSVATFFNVTEPNRKQPESRYAIRRGTRTGTGWAVAAAGCGYTRC